MSDAPDTYGELIDLWAGVGAARPLWHPSMPIWVATPDDDGRWTVTRDGVAVWAGMTGTPEDMVRLLEQMRRTDLPTRETAGVEPWQVEEAATAPPADRRWVDVLAWTLIGGYLAVVGAALALGAWELGRIAAGWLR